jgi:hypothetical protein
MDATFLRQHQLAAPATDFSATINNCRFYATHFSFPTLLYFSIESLPFQATLDPTQPLWSPPSPPFPHRNDIQVLSFYSANFFLFPSVIPSEVAKRVC